MCIRGLHICNPQRLKQSSADLINRPKLTWSSNLASFKKSYSKSDFKYRKCPCFPQAKRKQVWVISWKTIGCLALSFLSECWKKDSSRWYVKPEKDSRVAHEVDLYEGFQHPAFPSTSVTLSFLNTTVLRAHPCVKTNITFSGCGESIFRDFESTLSSQWTGCFALCETLPSLHSLS